MACRDRRVAAPLAGLIGSFCFAACARKLSSFIVASNALSDDDCRRLMLDELAGFNDAELAAAEAADQLTRSSILAPALGAHLRDHFTDKQIVEVMVLIGTYNMHARFVAGLNIELEQD